MGSGEAGRCSFSLHFIVAVFKARIYDIIPLKEEYAEGLTDQKATGWIQSTISGQYTHSIFDPPRPRSHELC